MGLDEQDITSVKHDVADFLMQSLPIGGHRHNDCVVLTAESRIANRHADQRTSIAYYGFDEAPLGARCFEVKYVFRRRHKSPHSLQLDDRLDDPHEKQPISTAQ